jgi:glycerol-3-phosphate dehydrogenase
MLVPASTSSIHGRHRWRSRMTRGKRRNIVDHEVTARGRQGVTTIHEARPTIRTRFVVNAAGLRGDELHRLGLDGFTIRPRCGELIVFDKLARPLLNAPCCRCRRRTPRASGG